MNIREYTMKAIVLSETDERQLYQSLQAGERPEICGKRILRWNIMGGTSRILLDGEDYEWPVELVNSPG